MIVASAPMADHFFDDFVQPSDRASITNVIRGREPFGDEVQAESVVKLSEEYPEGLTGLLGVRSQIISEEHFSHDLHRKARHVFVYVSGFTVQPGAHHPFSRLHHGLA